VAETFKEADVNSEKETTQPIDEIEQKEDSRRLEHPPIAENPELDKIKIEFYKTLKEFEGTDPTMRYQIPKQTCSRKLATIITTVNQEMLPDYLKHNVTSFLELHNTIYAAAVATVRLSEARIDGKKLNHIQNEPHIPPWERRLKKQIDDLRKDIGREQQAQKGNINKILQKRICRVQKKSTRTRQTRSKQCSHYGNT